MMVKKYIIFFLGLYSLFTLSGCAQYRWVSPGKSVTQFNQDQYDCNIESNKIYPPVFQTVLKAPDQFNQSYYDPNCAEGQNSTACVIRSIGNIMPTTEVIDANKDNRRVLFNQCMQSKDWRWEQVKK